MNQPWIYMCSPSWSPLPPSSPSHPSGSSQCTSPEHLSRASNLGWQSVSHLIIYFFQCYSLRSSQPHLLPQTLSDTMDQLDLIDIYRTFHPKTINFTFFQVHGTFSRIDHNLGHKSSLGKLKKIEIMPVIFSDHNAVRLDLNYRKKKLWKIQTYGG